MCFIAKLVTKIGNYKYKSALWHYPEVGKSILGVPAALKYFLT
jgi:hypothetical protein